MHACLVSPRAGSPGVWLDAERWPRRRRRQAVKAGGQADWEWKCGVS